MTPYEAHMNYKPGWYRIEMKDEPPLIRFFREGMSWLCDPQDFFQPRIAMEEMHRVTGEAELQISYESCCQNMICRGPVTQFDPSVWLEVASYPELIQEMEV